MRRQKDGALENAPFFDPSDRLPGGGWLSTSEDLARFAAAVMSGKLVNPHDLEQMWNPHHSGRRRRLRSWLVDREP